MGDVKLMGESVARETKLTAFGRNGTIIAYTDRPPEQTSYDYLNLSQSVNESKIRPTGASLAVVAMTWACQLWRVISQIPYLRLRRRQTSTKSVPLHRTGRAFSYLSVAKCAAKSTR